MLSFGEDCIAMIKLCDHECRSENGSLTFVLWSFMSTNMSSERQLDSWWESRSKMFPGLKGVIVTVFVMNRMGLRFVFADTERGIKRSLLTW